MHMSIELYGGLPVSAGAAVNARNQHVGAFVLLQLGAPALTVHPAVRHQYASAVGGWGLLKGTEAAIVHPAVCAIDERSSCIQVQRLP